MINISEVERCDLDKIYKEIEHSPKKIVVFAKDLLKIFSSLKNKIINNKNRV